MTREEFEALKGEILNRAKAANACREGYMRAYKAKNFEELCEVIKDNFLFCSRHNIIDTEIIKKYESEFCINEIFIGSSLNKGYTIIHNTIVHAYGNATVYAYGNATVYAHDNTIVHAYGNATVNASNNATIEAQGNATVYAYGNATVYAHGNATVYAHGNATIKAYSNATVYAHGNATVNAFGNATVYASDNATVYASDNATVYASDNAYITSDFKIKCNLSDNAIYRVMSDCTIYHASSNLKFIKND